MSVGGVTSILIPFNDGSGPSELVSVWVASQCLGSATPNHVFGVSWNPPEYYYPNLPDNWHTAVFARDTDPVGVCTAEFPFNRKASKSPARIAKLATARATAQLAAAGYTPLGPLQVSRVRDPRAGITITVQVALQKSPRAFQ